MILLNDAISTKNFEHDAISVRTIVEVNQVTVSSDLISACTIFSRRNPSIFVAHILLHVFVD